MCRRRWPACARCAPWACKRAARRSSRALATGAAQASLDAQRWEAAYEPAVGFTLSAATALTLGYGGWLVWQGQLTVGQLTSFSLYLGQLIWPMFAAGWVLSLLQRGKAAWGRLQPVLDAPLSVDDHGTRRARSRPARWSCKACASATPARHGPRCDGVSFRLQPGRTLGLVGPDRRRQIHAAAAAAAAPRAGSRHAALERRRSAGLHAWTPCAPPSPGCRRRPSCSPRRVAENIALARPQAQRASRSSRRPGSPRCTRTSCACRRATTRRWASAASPCRAASGSASRSPVRCWPMRRCCCWTTRCRRWTPTPKRASWRTCGKRASGRTVIIVSHRLSAVADADQIVVLREGRVVEQGTPRRVAGAQRLVCAPVALPATGGEPRCQLNPMTPRRVAGAQPAARRKLLGDAAALLVRAAAPERRHLLRGVAWLVLAAGLEALGPADRQVADRQLPVAPQRPHSRDRRPAARRAGRPAWLASWLRYRQLVRLAGRGDALRAARFARRCTATCCACR